MNYMPFSIQDKLERIQQDHIKGDFLNSIAELDELLKKEEITIEERIKAKILKSQIVNALTTLGYEHSSFDYGMKLAQEVIRESRDIKDKNLKFDSLLNLELNYFNLNKWQELQKLYAEIIQMFDELEPSKDLDYLKRKAQIITIKGIIPLLRTYSGESATEEELEKGFQILIEGEKFCEKNNLSIYQLSILANIGFILTNRGELDSALEISQKMVDICKGAKNKLAIAYSLDFLAQSYYQKNDYKKFYELSKERLVIAEELEIEGMIANTYNNIGLYYLVIGEYDEALNYYTRSLEIYQNINRENAIAITQEKCGYVYFLKGDFDKAIEFYDKAYPVLKENQPQQWYEIFSGFAAVYIQKGELDRALEFLYQLMTIHKGMQNLLGISYVLSEQGMIYWQKGMKEQALSFIQESLEIRQKISNKALVSASLSYLIQFNVELNNIKEARKYFESLDLINEEIKNKHVSQNHKYSEALILKTSSNLRDKVKAELLFEQLVEEDILYPILIQVLLHLCDILLLEMKETNEPEVLKKIYKHVNRLQELSEKNKSHVLLVETLRLKAQLSLLEFDVEEARTLLLDAQNIAQKNGLDRLVLTLLKQQEDLIKQSIELKKLEKTSSSISHRMSVVKLEDTVENIKRTSLTKTISREEEVSRKLFSIQI
ncbi:MAG: tetratricopeptide repeat protein [Candidatus Heimdallarchaeota archaeon]|nr:tetratricopeptide repeat protein [Candidatus Heimdallarchaeota archaeon]MCK4611092.1 tetratricopeptide repeat protein [Candidatus Heimdallarchaeota archaeon]